MKVDLSKKYRTRDGLDVMLYHIHHDSSSLYKVHGAVKYPERFMWCPQSWTLAGEVFVNHRKAQDLVEISPYEDFKIDDPVIVKETLSMACHAHFAGITEEGFPTVWAGGGTSWTTRGRLVVSKVHRPEE